jgi:hypothetical protein
MLFTIQRKEFKQALSDMVNIFPMLGVAIVAATNYMTSANKILYLMASNLDTTYMNIDKWENMSINDFNKISSFDLEKIYEIFIKPNEDRIPFLKRGLNLIGLDNMMKKYKYEKDNILDKYNNISSLDKTSNILENVPRMVGDSTNVLTKRISGGNKMMKSRVDEFMNKFINIQNDIKNLI